MGAVAEVHVLPGGGARAVGGTVEAALEVLASLVRAEGEGRCVRRRVQAGHEVEARLRARPVEIADRRRGGRLPTRERARVALEEVAYPERPGPLPLLPVEAGELVVLRPKAAGVGSRP